MINDQTLMKSNSNNMIKGKVTEVITNNQKSGSETQKQAIGTSSIMTPFKDVIEYKPQMVH